MAQKIKKNILNLVLKYKDTIEKAGIPVEHIVIFGSYAKGTAKLDSDIDLGVVSKKFGKDEMSELGKLQFLKWKLDNRIEAHPISLKDYQIVATPFINEIRKYGVLV